MKKISLDSQPTALHLFLTLTKKSYLKSGFKKIEIENKKTWKCIITKVMGGCLFYFQACTTVASFKNPAMHTCMFLAILKIHRT